MRVATEADIRRHAVQMVRGRGPLPPLRIGRQPYGVLPVTSLRSWQPGKRYDMHREMRTLTLRISSSVLFGHDLEEALRIKEKTGAGEVVVVSMGPQRAKGVIKDALARGPTTALVGSKLGRYTGHV